MRQHTSAYVYLNLRQMGNTGTSAIKLPVLKAIIPMPFVVSIRQHTSEHTSAYVSIRQHTSAYVSILQHTSPEGNHTNAVCRQHTSVYVSFRQHASAYVSIRQHTSAYVT